MDEGFSTNNTPVNGYAQTGTAGAVVTENVNSNKSKVAAALLNFFFGTLGAHRFYLGKIGTGILMLLLTIIGAATAVFYVGWVFVGIVGIWDLIDFIVIIIGRMKDGQGKFVK